MKIVAFIILSICSIPVVYGQNEDLTIENGLPYNRESIDSCLNYLHEKNDFVLTFKTKATAFSRNKDYFIITRNADSFTAYKYIHQSFDHLSKLNLPTDSIKKMWRSFIDNDLFRIKNYKDISNNCPQDSFVKNGTIVYYSNISISDSHMYEFYILSKNEMKRLNYYDPEFFENHCGSVPERQKIIKCVSTISQIVL